MMKLLLVIVRDEDALKLLDKLIDEGFQVTKISSTGGFLRVGNSTLLLGVEEDKVERVIEVIENYKLNNAKCTQSAGTDTKIQDKKTKKSGKVSVGDATIFMLDVEKFIKY